ncbi:alpha/beta hydrolase [Paraburkholderia sp. SARCC-3016]|uniref:alpha/beta fold hydrolase n=1 Tax=Paraburkholderia sp. SARCC-3016 TaxID=3058611 RepID=UPI00280683D9|nr:alpha/beta hydrolase [Paraburkholderia sp. SARCC-3016]MDQ7981298.1 alpha/beta hydrolase [Paraburkholderia sp. SARCC-3016]
MNIRRKLAMTLIASLGGLTAIATAAGAHAEIQRYTPEPMCKTMDPQNGIEATAREQIAETPRGQFAYYRLGQGSPLVLVTGFRATLTEWDAAFLTELAKHHDVIVFDNRGVGRSEADTSSFSIDDMARDTAALIDALHLRKPTLVGWSMGGAIVQQLAIDSPASMGKMVLLSAPAPGSFGTPLSPQVEATLSGKPGVTLADVMGVLFPAADVSDAERCFKQDMFTPADYGTHAISGTVTAGQTEALRNWESNDRAGQALRAVHISTLVMSGNDDTVVVQKNAEALEQLLPNARLLVVDGAGHAMMYQYPVALARTINSFAGE